MSVPPIRIVPSVRTPSTRSFMRFRQRSSVDLPQPDGPMNAVMRCFGTTIVTSWSACFVPYHSDTLSISTMTGSSIGGRTPVDGGNVIDAGDMGVLRGSGVVIPPRSGTCGGDGGGGGT